MELTTVTLSVPTDRVADIYAFASTLYSKNSTDAPSSDQGAGDFDREAIRRAYEGGVSEYWRPFLRLLAHQANEWVAWGDLCDGIGMTRTQAAGMLGAAERRCAGDLPYEKSGYTEKGYWFRMSGQAAEVVLGLAEAR